MVKKLSFENVGSGGTGDGVSTVFGHCPPEISSIPDGNPVVFENETDSFVDFSDKIKALSAALSLWNKEVFGHLFHKRKLILARIGGIQKARDRNANPFLINLEADLIQEIFSADDYVDSRFIILWLFPPIGNEDLVNLCRPISLLEVKNSLFSIGGLKAHGYDGFPAICYQHHWDIYSNEIFNIVQTAFSSCRIPDGLNHTLIALIPKNLTSNATVDKSKSEKLSHLIQFNVDLGCWRAVSASQSGPKVSHLFFADDLVLFAEASPSQAIVMKRCLDQFCSLSGQAVSFEKSLLFCSPNTCKSLAAAISRTCGSPLTAHLGKYLVRGVVHGASLLKRGLNWRIGDGKTISQVINVPTGFDGGGVDKLIWGHTSNGNFSLKSAYNLNFDLSNATSLLWKALWKLKTPPKLKTFYWSLLHKKLLTNVQRVRRNFTADKSCPIYNNADETLLHLFRDCPRSSAIWNEFLSPGPILNFFTQNQDNWIAAQVHCRSVIQENVKWCNLFVFICWFI
ncbi:hypothetical protein ACLB2K_059597 [Fragaria x ananassa]